jgi:antirestriction protein ArdC
MKTCTATDSARADQSPKQNVYARITAKIVAALEDGVRPWVRPWNPEHAAPIWMTYRQAVQLGAHVRKGEQGSPVVYANSITRNETNATSGDEIARDIHFLKGYTVFNVEQIDGLPAQYTAPESPRLDASARIDRADRFFGATGATLAHGGNRAFYRPSTDSIVLPRFETFRDAESYYATLAHETTQNADSRIMPRSRRRSLKSGTVQHRHSA